MKSYLEPISGSMQKTIEGRVAIGEKHNQNHVGKAARTYLERIRNRMHEPIEGLLAQRRGALNKGGGLVTEHNSTDYFTRFQSTLATAESEKQP